MAKLTAHVHVHDDKRGTVVFAADTDRDDLPEWARDKIGDHAFDDYVDPASDTATEEPSADEPPAEESPALPDGAPPLAGKGSTTAAWREYAAEEYDLEFDEDAPRDDIVAAVAEAHAASGS